MSPQPILPSNKSSQWLRFCVDVSRLYLSSGGPTSRLEGRLTETGLSLGQPTESYATPTGMFVSIISDPPLTAMGRIPQSTTNLGELMQLENLLESLFQGNLSLDEAEKGLAEIQSARRPLRLEYLAHFLIGTAASYSFYGLFQPALISGGLCALAGILTGALGKRLQWSGIFGDFLAALMAFLLSGLIASWCGWIADSLVVGTLILLVPGLTLTNAISELAEQNFVSGTAKLMKGILILLAIGTAFLLAKDLSRYLFPGLDYSPMASLDQASPSLKWVCQTILLLSFCYSFCVPWKWMGLSLIPGLLSWVVVNSFEGGNFLALSSFLSALTVGVISLALGRAFRIPSQVFSVPGVLSLVPGLLALSSFYTQSPIGPTSGIGLSSPAALPQQHSILFQALVIAASIVFGLLCSRIPFSLSRAPRHHLTQGDV